MPTQARPYEFAPAIRHQAEQLRVTSYREAIRGSIALHSITADKIAVGVLNVGSGAVTIDNGAITAAKLNVTNLAAITAQLGSVTSGDITATDIHGGTINGTTINGVDITGSSSITGGSISGGAITGSSYSGGTISGTAISGSSIQLGTGVPRVYGDSTGIRAVGDGASYRFFAPDDTGRTGAARCNLPISGGNQIVQSEIVAYTGYANDVRTSAGIRVRNGGSDIDQGFVRVFGNGDVSGSSAYTNSSDRRLKRQIRDVSRPLAAVRDLRPRTFVRRHGGSTEAGFIAQELLEVLPNLVRHHEQDEEPMLGITYDGIHAYTVGAIQELAARVEALEG